MRVAAVLAATMGTGLIFGFQPPLIALNLARKGASSFEIGAVMGASTVAVITLGPFYPRLIQWLGLRSAILAGTVLAVGVLLAMPIFETLPVWLGLRVLTGCAVGLAWIASEVWLNLLASDKTRGTLIGIYATIASVGAMAGPILLQLTGTIGWRPFYVGAIGLALTVVPMLFASNTPVADPELQPAQRLAGILKAAPLIMLAALIAGLVESADISLLPLFGLYRGLDEHTSLLIVTVFLAGNVFLQLPIGRLADRLGRRPILAASAIVNLIGPLILTPVVTIPMLLWPLLFVWGGTVFGFYTQGIALLGDMFGEHDLAAANTAFVMAYCAGGVLGPTLGGVAMDLWMPTGLLVYVSGAALVILAALIRDHLRKRSAPPAACVNAVGEEDTS
jgi:MFS family permease